LGHCVFAEVFSRPKCRRFDKDGVLQGILGRRERGQGARERFRDPVLEHGSWKHVNLYGAYSFLDIGDGVDLQELVNLLEAARGRGAAAPD
jgi:hypothetical protein